MARRSNYWILLFAVLGFFFIFAPTVTFPFQFDDHSNILFNRAIRYLDNPRVFFETMHQRDRPLTNVSFALNYALHGLRIEGYHWFNIFLHFANALLLGLLLRKIFPKFAPWNWLAALFFLLHPMSVDAVTYISGRSTLLVLFFLLLACLSFATDKLPAGVRYSFAALFGLAAFFSKESAAILPLLLAGVVFVRGRKWKRVEAVLFGIFLALALCFVAIKWRYLSGAWAGFFRFQGDVLITSKKAAVLYWLSIWWESLRLFVDPKHLAIDHGVKAIPTFFAGKAVFLYLFFLAALFGAVAAFRRGKKIYFFGIVWFFCALLPTHSIFPVLDPVAEHNLYLALPGAVLILAAFLSEFKQRSAFLVAAVLAAALFAGSFGRKGDWRSHASLWRANYQVYPDKLRVALNYADGLEQEFGDEREAFHVLTGWLKENPLERRPYEEQKAVIEAILFNGKKVFGKKAGNWERELERSLPGKKNLFWRDYLVNALRLQTKGDFRASWQEANRDLRNLPAPDSHKDPQYWRNMLDLQMASFSLEKQDWRRARALYARVFSQFESDELPYWADLFPYAKALRALGDTDRERLALEELVKHYFVYKIYFPPALLRLGELYEKEGDWLRASDAYGELIRTKLDDPSLREKYRMALAHVDAKRAAVQAEQSKFFAKRRVTPLDPREWLSH